MNNDVNSVTKNNENVKSFYTKNYKVFWHYVDEDHVDMEAVPKDKKTHKFMRNPYMEIEEFNKLRFSRLTDLSKVQCKEYCVSEGIDEKDITFTDLWNAHCWLMSHTQEQKRENFTIKRFFGDKFSLQFGMFYSSDSSIPENYVETATPSTKISNAITSLGREVIMFDIGKFEDFPVLTDFRLFDSMVEEFKDPNFGTSLTEEEIETFKGMDDITKSVMFMLLYGFTDISTGKTYYLLNASASKIRAGGQFLMVEGNPELSWLENWKFIEEVIRPKAFGLEYDNYRDTLEKLSNKPQLKIETGFALGLSSSLPSDEIANKLRGSEIADKINNFKIEVVDDIEVEIEACYVIPDYDCEQVKSKPENKPFFFKKIGNTK